MLYLLWAYTNRKMDPWNFLALTIIYQVLMWPIYVAACYKRGKSIWVMLKEGIIMNLNHVLVAWSSFLIFGMVAETGNGANRAIIKMGGEGDITLTIISIAAKGFVQPMIKSIVSSLWRLSPIWKPTSTVTTEEDVKNLLLEMLQFQIIYDTMFSVPIRVMVFRTPTLFLFISTTCSSLCVESLSRILFAWYQSRKKAKLLSVESGELQESEKRFALLDNELPLPPVAASAISKDENDFERESKCLAVSTMPPNPIIVESDVAAFVVADVDQTGMASRGPSTLATEGIQQPGTAPSTTRDQKQNVLQLPKLEAAITTRSHVGHALHVLQNFKREKGRNSDKANRVGDQRIATSPNDNSINLDKELFSTISEHYLTPEILMGMSSFATTLSGQGSRLLSISVMELYFSTRTPWASCNASFTDAEISFRAIFLIAIGSGVDYVSVWAERHIMNFDVVISAKVLDEIEFGLRSLVMFSLLVSSSICSLLAVEAVKHRLNALENLDINTFTNFGRPSTFLPMTVDMEWSHWSSLLARTVLAVLIATVFLAAIRFGFPPLLEDKPPWDTTIAFCLVVYLSLRSIGGVAKMQGLGLQFARIFISVMILAVILYLLWVYSSQIVTPWGYLGITMAYQVFIWPIYVAACYKEGKPIRVMLKEGIVMDFNHVLVAWVTFLIFAVVAETGNSANRAILSMGGEGDLKLTVTAIDEVGGNQSVETIANLERILHGYIIRRCELKLKSKQLQFQVIYDTMFSVPIRVMILRTPTFLLFFATTCSSFTVETLSRIVFAWLQSRRRAKMISRVSLDSEVTKGELIREADVLKTSELPNDQEVLGYADLPLPPLQMEEPISELSFADETEDAADNPVFIGPYQSGNGWRDSTMISTRQQSTNVLLPKYSVSNISNVNRTGTLSSVTTGLRQHSTLSTKRTATLSSKISVSKPTAAKLSKLESIVTTRGQFAHTGEMIERYKNKSLAKHERAVVSGNVTQSTLIKKGTEIAENRNDDKPELIIIDDTTDKSYVSLSSELLPTPEILMGMSSLATTITGQASRLLAIIVIAMYFSTRTPWAACNASFTHLEITYRAAFFLIIGSLVDYIAVRTERHLIKFDVVISAKALDKVQFGLQTLVMFGLLVSVTICCLMAVEAGIYYRTECFR
ncbi:hypothetical protein HDU76_010368 [Blyttiomyces sp. JEL0837]|nr:hypothetical protein HDU76_010368 [Blyttiomyces sp. JEL0837]